MNDNTSLVQSISPGKTWTWSKVANAGGKLTNIVSCNVFPAFQENAHPVHLKSIRGKIGQVFSLHTVTALQPGIALDSSLTKVSIWVAVVVASVCGLYLLCLL